MNTTSCANALFSRYNTATMFLNMQDDVPIEVVKIKVAPAFRGFVHQFPNYSLTNSEGASQLCAIKICKNNYIQYNKPIYWRKLPCHFSKAWEFSPVYWLIILGLTFT